MGKINLGGRLLFRLQKLPHAYPEESGAPYEAWGEISISYAKEKMDTKIVHCQWDLALLIEWFLQNRIAICTEQLVINEERPFPTETLSQALKRFHHREFEEEDGDREFSWFDTLLKYLQRHDLVYGLEGSRMPNIILGCNGSIGELSSPNPEWVYKFNMFEFVDQFLNEIVQFLDVWENSTNDITAVTRISNIRNSLF